MSTIKALETLKSSSGLIEGRSTAGYLFAGKVSQQRCWTRDLRNRCSDDAMSNPDRRPVVGDGLAKKLEDLAAPVAEAMTSVIPPLNEDHPTIPLSIIDAPSQRAYAFAIYAALFAWRIYDYTTLLKDDADSLFYFMKWATIDGLYIYGLPALRIPWLEWSGTTSLILFAIHAVLDWMLMFRVSVIFDASEDRVEMLMLCRSP